MAPIGRRRLFTSVSAFTRGATIGVTALPAAQTVAHALLVTAYHLLARGTTDEELGANYYDRRNTERITRQAVHALERQGFRVTLEHAA